MKLTLSSPASKWIVGPTGLVLISISAGVGMMPFGAIAGFPLLFIGAAFIADVLGMTLKSDGTRWLKFMGAIGVLLLVVGCIGVAVIMAESVRAKSRGLSEPFDLVGLLVCWLPGPLILLTVARFAGRIPPGSIWLWALYWMSFAPGSMLVAWWLWNGRTGSGN